ncbi:hypothetical protein T484DRAFT_1882986 [Baffinella frigidus]|nr:hypothetical protein T484DRAFT_1882986 [Cryptophyta sp. CCMP2293]
MRWALLLALALAGWPSNGTGRAAGGARFEREVKIRFDTQPLAVNASLRALGKHKAKTRKLGPAVLHFAGADVTAKRELAEALADQFAALLPPSCAHVARATLDASSGTGKVCEALSGWAVCPEQVLVLEGVTRDSMGELEALLQKLTQEQVLVLEGVTRDSMAELEALLQKLTQEQLEVLLQKLTQEQVLACGTRPTDQWTIILVSSLGGGGGGGGVLCRGRG